MQNHEMPTTDRYTALGAWAENQGYMRQDVADMPTIKASTKEKPAVIHGKKGIKVVRPALLGKEQH